MAKKTKPVQEDMHREALDNFEKSNDLDRKQRQLAIEDLIFIHSEDGQWSEDITVKRKDRPRYTVDRISGAIDQIVGNQRQTRLGVKVIPQQDGEEKTAQTLSGLIRNIERESNASNAFDSGFYEQLISGYGGWQVKSEYESDSVFEQCIKIKPIMSAASSLFFDPSAKEYDKSDGKFAFLISRMLIDDFRKKWPDATVTDFDQEQYKRGSVGAWFTQYTVRIADYWYKKPHKTKIGLLSDGRVIDLEEEESVLDELAAAGVTVAREREAESWKIEMVVMNGAEILTEPQEWAGKYIPLVPLYGKQAVINGEHYTRGIVRKAKDAQRIYNYATSSAIEATALTPKDPIWITVAQAKGHTRSLKNFPTQNSPFMLFNGDPAAPGAPSRGGAPQLQTALLQQIEQAARDIHSTTGLEPASLGNVPELKSGKAIEAQQAMGDRGTFIFQDNLKKSLRHTGQILVDLIPRIYDTQRVIKVLGEDESLETITINEEIIDEQTGESVLVNDLSQGNYGVEVVSGPAFATKRRETVEQLISLASSSPIVQNLALDLIVANMELNNGDEINKRIRKNMIKEGTVEPTDEEIKELGLDQPQQPDPMNQAVIENLKAQTERLLIQNEETISKVKNIDADSQQKILSAQKTSIDSFTELRDSLLDKLDKGIPITPQDLELLNAQTAIVEEGQINVLERGELAESPPASLPA